MKIKEIPFFELPREKALKQGIDKLSNSELLALFIRSGTKEKNAIEIACELLYQIPSLKYLKEISYIELLNIKGIGKSKALEILAVIELAKRIENDNKTNIKLDSADIIFKIFHPLLKDYKQEHLYAIYVNSKNVMIAYKEISIGNINQVIVDINEIIKWYYQLKASGLYLIHNHPSGIVKPSNEDIKLTKNLVNKFQNLNITFIDHLIIGNNYYSFYKESDIFKIK